MPSDAPPGAERPIAFVCAMPTELRPLTRRLGLERTELGGGPARTGTLDGHPVVGIVTGMGTKLATAGIERLLGAVTPARVVVVGITGAVDDEIAIGALVRPERVVDAATGREHRHEALDDAPLQGVMWTTDLITKADELPALRAQGVISLDMETAAIAQACEARGVPWTVIRAISDRATDGSIDDEVFALSNMDGTPNLKAVVRYVLRHPLRLPRLARMGRDAQRATEQAAEAAIDAVRGSLRSSPPRPPD